MVVAVSPAAELDGEACGRYGGGGVGSREGGGGALWRARTEGKSG